MDDVKRNQHIPPEWWTYLKLPATDDEVAHARGLMQGSRTYLTPILVPGNDPLLSMFPSQIARLNANPKRFNIEPWAIRFGFLNRIVEQLQHFFAWQTDYEASIAAEPEHDQLARVMFRFERGAYCLNVEGVTLCLPEPSAVQAAPEPEWEDEGSDG